jgi:hypothetical protein
VTDVYRTLIAAAIAAAIASMVSHCVSARTPRLSRSSRQTQSRRVDDNADQEQLP